MFVVEHGKEILFNFSNLKVFVPAADYLLAIKVLALRAESLDTADAGFLIKRSGFQTEEDILRIVADYYPNKEIKPETVFQLEEIFERLK